MQSHPHRSRPVRQPLRQLHNRPSLVFLTVCTKDRKQILARDDAHNAILNAWEKADHWSVGRYVVMPDHIHLFCAPASDDALDLARWAAYWRSEASRHWPRPEEQPIWQRDVWDTQLRSRESYNAKWEYVRNNPVRHGHVERPEDWSYAGEITVFEW